ncbi:nucleotidyl transferase AbiEii/AbiGii toxin family protein [Sphingomonas sp. OK281]|jgi:predicted nucleotidyltransferase component of viral defense system|uniref:nucleotidyl transferase AbiEii/AbiGii toxin family protein n=1 Tax=Sphingomonas sp. OK281 TaxID=1881067 RepID=UPI0008F2EC02|nr:nucleotidyl transferase AbiEii/AbiGii toxin family protein [Sphingomonas sp. OK281]SFO47405.1 Nucleotidyl transferase AbiEii toxin, Type IV TA system [Sphingomonas sp. OK281]
MSNSIEEGKQITVNIGEWIEKARLDPQAYLERQVTEIFLTALAMTKPFSHEIFLKGGILMGVVYKSPRQTGDVDFTAISEPNMEMAEALKAALNDAFPRAAAKLGYPDLMCNVQSSRYEPSAKMFAKATGPLLALRVGYAKRGAPQERLFRAGTASDVLDVDIAFREPVNAIQIVQLGEGVTIRAYSLLDLIAEKLRALLQQPKRNRNRRQDVYDIASLLEKFSLDESEKTDLLAFLHEKCRARDINPDRDALGQLAVRDRAKKDWNTLGLELEELPDFDHCFDIVNEFYRSLPWN